MNVLILGAGKMGVAIGYAMKKLNYDLGIVEQNDQNVATFQKVNGNCKVFRNWSVVDYKPDIVISALPYHAILEFIPWIIDKKLRYCDLGGSVPVSNNVKKLAEENRNERPIMTDLGLAPGWINILAEEIYRNYPDIKMMKMMVGGIPALPLSNDPLNYITTWSMDGLINEYKDDCEVLRKGEKHICPGMSLCENLIIGNMELEAFCTSGAMAHSLSLMQSRGLQDCYYKTLRWRGHCKVVQFLLPSPNMLKECLMLSNNLHADNHRIASNPDKDGDLVVMHVIAENGNCSVSRTRKIYSDNKFSAMQKATAFPISSVADIMAKGILDNFKYPSYADIPLDLFNENIEILFKE